MWQPVPSCMTGTVMTHRECSTFTCWRGTCPTCTTCGKLQLLAPASSSPSCFRQIVCLSAFGKSRIRCASGNREFAWMLHTYCFAAARCCCAGRRVRYLPQHPQIQQSSSSRACLDGHGWIPARKHTGIGFNVRSHGRTFEIFQALHDPSTGSPWTRQLRHVRR